ncbi:MAG: hypothetical protein ACE5K3_00975 [bacterium]
MLMKEREEYKELWDLKMRAVELTPEQKKRYDELLVLKMKENEEEKELTEGEKEIKRIKEKQGVIQEKVEQLREAIEKEVTKDSPGRQKARQLFGDSVRTEYGKPVMVETDQSRKWGTALVLLDRKNRELEERARQIRLKDSGVLKFIEKGGAEMEKRGADAGYEKPSRKPAFEGLDDFDKDKLEEILGPEGRKLADL